MTRTVVGLVIYLVVVAVLSLVEDLRAVNMRLVGRSGLLGAQAQLSDNLSILDVPLDDDSNMLERDRQSIAALLQRLVQEPQQRPEAIVLDIDISNDKRGLDELTKAIHQVRAAGVKFYIAANPEDESGTRCEQSHSEGYFAPKAPLYQEVDGRYGHTCMKASNGVLRYDAQIVTPDGLVIHALPIVVTGSPEEIFDVQPKPRLLRLGTVAAREHQTWTWNFNPGLPTAGMFVVHEGNNTTLDLKGKTIIIGDLSTNVDFNKEADRYGAELLAWAISENMRGASSTLPDIIESPAWAVAVTLGMSLLSAWLFRKLFHLWPSQRQRLWVLGPLAAGLTVLLFAALVLSLHTLSVLYVQWVLALAGIGVATGVTGYTLKVQMLIDALKLDMDNPQRLTASTYDVFISYSRTPRENLDWVSTQVVPRLEEAGLKVWFDKKSIFLGTSWYEKIAQGIQGSRYFVPIYSQDYFKKAFCRVELELAAIRRAHETNFILPLARVKTDIPPGYQHINFIDVNERQDFIDLVLEAVKQRPQPD